MFSWFKPKDPLINLNKQYRQKLEQAMHSQRNGDIRTYSALTAEAEVHTRKHFEGKRQAAPNGRCMPYRAE